MVVAQPEKIGDGDLCRQARRWGVSDQLLQLTAVAAEKFRQETGRNVWIISGYRTPQEQRDLTRLGRPTAPEGKSTHTTCPATGLDVWIGSFPSRWTKAIWGRNLARVGLRWGGGSSRDSAGIPSDWPHIDLGPR